VGIKTTAPTHAGLAVRANAGLMVGAGGLLLLGMLPRLAAVLLAASLVPTSLVGHQFWKKEGPERKQQLIHFLKNAATIGGLLLLAEQPAECEVVEPNNPVFLPLDLHPSAH